jgi:hypothetical protein
MFERALLARMASNSKFTIRSSAASICMDFAQFVPDKVPLDIVFQLSKYDEDWYVMAPAMAVLKTLVRSIPHVSAFFIMDFTIKIIMPASRLRVRFLIFLRRNPNCLTPFI